MKHKRRGGEPRNLSTCANMTVTPVMLSSRTCARCTRILRPLPCIRLYAAEHHKDCEHAPPGCLFSLNTVSREMI